MTQRKRITRRRAAAATIAVIAGASAATLGEASASARRATVLHLFAKEQAFGMFRANGRPLSPTTTPKRGDYLIGTNVDYVGDHNKHAATPAGADNAVCTFTSATKAICDEVIALDGSLLLVNHVTVNFAAPRPVSRITGGTGRFTGARGTVTVTPLNLNSEFVVKYSVAQ